MARKREERQSFVVEHLPPSHAAYDAALARRLSPEDAEASVLALCQRYGIDAELSAKERARAIALAISRAGGGIRVSGNRRRRERVPGEDDE